jgi:hypothetical protein
VALYLNGCILLADGINCPVGYDRLKLFIGWSTSGPVVSYWVIALLRVSARFGPDATRLLSLVAYSVGSVYCPVAVFVQICSCPNLHPFSPDSISRSGRRKDCNYIGWRYLDVCIFIGWFHLLPACNSSRLHFICCCPIMVLNREKLRYIIG